MIELVVKIADGDISRSYSRHTTPKSGRVSLRVPMFKRSPVEMGMGSADRADLMISVL